jgi:nucleoside-diphosphate-sugar epimerase
VLDVTLARRVLGWSPSTSLDVGLVQTLEHFKREIVAR